MRDGARLAPDQLSPDGACDGAHAAFARGDEDVLAEVADAVDGAYDGCGAFIAFFPLAMVGGKNGIYR